VQENRMVSVMNLLVAANTVAYTVKPDKADALREAIQTKLIPAARQTAGYRGFLVLDQGEGRRLGVVVFDSAEHAKAAQQAISQAAKESGIYGMMEGGASNAFGLAIAADGIFSGG